MNRFASSVLLLLFSCYHQSAFAFIGNSRRTCPLKYRPIVLLTPDDNSTEDNEAYKIVERYGYDQLHESDNYISDNDVRFLRQVHTKGNITDDFLVGNDTHIYARECNCFSRWRPTAYCPMVSTHCSIYRNKVDYVECAIQSPKQEMSLILLYMLIFATLLCCCYGIGVGRFVYGYIHTLVSDFCCYCCSWNSSNDNNNNDDINSNFEQIRRYFHHNTAIRAMIREYRHDQRRQERLAKRVTSLDLKTKIYNENATNNNYDGNATMNNDHNNDMSISDDDIPSCSICFGELKTGQRVGDLTCQHVFHVDCLKTWLRRCNKCPLCQQEEIAKPHTALEQTAKMEQTATGSDSFDDGDDSNNDYTNADFRHRGQQ